MPESFRYGLPGEAADYVHQLEKQNIEPSDLAEYANLFNEDRIRDSQEAIFMMNEARAVLAVAIVSKYYPNILSYYTVPMFRGHKYGYKLLVECIRRISIVTGGEPDRIFIEPTSEGARKNIEALPDDLRNQLCIFRTE